MKPAYQYLSYHQYGFTLIEMVIVLIIMGIITSFILGTSTTGGNDMVAETEILKSHLRYAQVRAMNDTVPWGIHVLNAGSYILYRNNIQATALLPGENGQTHTLPSGITTTGAGTTYNFNEWGSPGTSTLTITLSQGTETRNITMTKNTGYIP